jgi:hypothetical protein
MPKQRKVSKKQRRLRREEQRRQARTEVAPLDDVLVKDLTYLAERGVMASTKRFEDAAFDAMYKSSRWRTEPEFADLSFDPVDAGRAITRIVSEEPDLADQVKRLRGSAREDKTFDVNRRAIDAAMSPAFKQQFFTRLDRFRQRLRAQGNRETLAQAALVDMTLRMPGKSGELWGACMLVYQIYSEALDQYFRLSDATETAIMSAQQTLGDVSIESVLQAPSGARPAEAALLEATKKTPGLMDFLQRQVYDMIDEALGALFMGEINLGLFTEEELETLVERTADLFAQEGWENFQAVGKADQRRMAESLHSLAVETLGEIDTPERRAEIFSTARQRVKELSRRQKEREGGLAAALAVLLSEETPLGESSIMTRAFLGEMFSAVKRQAGEE